MMKKARIGWKAVVKVKLGPKDAHYQGGLVAGAKILELFGDAATQLCLREAGVEGLFRAYQEVEFLRPVYAGDTVVATATIIKIGNTSRTMKFVATKSGKHAGGVVVCKAMGTIVIPEMK